MSTGNPSVPPIIGSAPGHYAIVTTTGGTSTSPPLAHPGFQPFAPLTQPSYANNSVPYRGSVFLQTSVGESNVPMIKIVGDHPGLYVHLPVLLNNMGHACSIENGFIICETLGIIFKYDDPKVTGVMPRPKKHCRLVEVPQKMDFLELQKILNTILVFNTNPMCSVPARKPDSVGFDLHCCNDGVIQPKEMTDISTGIFCSFPVDVWGLLVSRSSTFKKKITTNTAIIDPGYQGELFVCCYNWGDTTFEFKAGDRLAQLIPIKDTPFISMMEVGTKREFPDTQRGDKGFGSSGR